MRLVLTILLSVGLIAVLEGAYYAFHLVRERRSRELKRRLQALGATRAGAASLLRQGRFARSAILDAMLRPLPSAQRLERLLDAAGAGLTVAQVLGYSVVLLVGALLLTLAFGLPAMVAAMVTIAAGVAPVSLLLVSAGRRSRKLSEQLPEALEMMSRSLRAGHATIAAFQMVATELPDPVSVEFGRAFEEQRLGLPLDQAIVHLVERMPRNHDLKIFAVSTIVQKETGGNLAEILCGIAETIRARYRFRGKLRALTAEGRASAAVLGLLPFVLIIGLQLLSPAYFTPLFTERAGHLLLLYAVCTWAGGLLWLLRLTRVDL
jgi:tight adherence protein B